jgi:methylamine utilization protein MauE
MSPWKDRIVAGAAVLLGAMWLFAASLKIARPVGALELTAHLVPASVPSKAAVAAAVGAETILGAAMCLRAIRGFVPSLALLLVFSGFLLVARSQVEGTLVPCGCFGDLFGASIDEALVRNGVLVALHLGLILWGRAKPST